MSITNIAMIMLDNVKQIISYDGITNDEKIEFIEKLFEEKKR